MVELLPFLKSLISAPGLSGHEAAVRGLIEETWRPLVEEISVSRLGSLHALRRGSGPEPRPSLLLAAHMDAIGLMVTGITDGFLHITAIGGLDPRVLPGQLVAVHGREELPGVIARPASHLLPESIGQKPVPIEYLLVDTGLNPADVAALVRVGDLVSFAQSPIEMEGDVLAGHSLDDRASVAAVTHCLDLLQTRAPAWDVWAVATVQEEVTMAGAATSAVQLHPSLAVAVDVTFGTSPGTPGYASYPMGKGITLGWGPSIHPALFEAFKKLAEELEIPYQLEVMPHRSGTDADSLQVASEGVPTMVVGIPLRYMHTPVEIISLKDVTRAGRLLAEFAAGLDVNFLDQMIWEGMVE